jgi:hypothetical protein
MSLLWSFLVLWTNRTGVVLKNTKLASLAMKYFSTPPRKLYYYLNIPSDTQEMIEENKNAPEVLPAQTRARKKARKEKNTNADINLVGACKPGRPKQPVLLQKACQSILNLFSKT